MLLVAVTRIRNEDDIVEAFVRHHAVLVDRHIFLDNGSNDRTVEILRALKADGLPLTLYSAPSISFAETVQNTFLFRQAASLGADWVLHLDCDEFLDTRGLDAGGPMGDLHRYFATVPNHVECVEVEMFNYEATTADDTAEMVVPLRLRRRAAAGIGVGKVIVRARLAARGAVVERGNHAVSVDGTRILSRREPGLRLAHFHNRTGWQVLAKAVVGRLKVLAAGQTEIAGGSSQHYTEILFHLDAHPEWLLLDPEFTEGQRPPEKVTGGVVEDPIAYLGGALRHTRMGDPRMHAVRSMFGYATELAARHGVLMDASAEVQRREAEAAHDFRQIF